MVHKTVASNIAIRAVKTIDRCIALSFSTFLDMASPRNLSDESSSPPLDGKSDGSCCHSPGIVASSPRGVLALSRLRVYMASTRFGVH
jgi:hypothetical protein